MQLQKIKIAQPTKNLMISAQELLVMMVMMEITLVVVPPHLPHKEEVMSDLPPFTADQFTHCTQDENHGVPTSSRIPVSEANALIDSSDSSSQWIDDVSVPGPYTYHIPDIHNQQPTRWIYEWVDLKLYNMCYQDWRCTAE
jgi:hypothetical protein